MIIFMIKIMKIMIKSIHIKKAISLFLSFSYLPVCMCGALSEARSDIPLANIIESLLVALNTSCVTVCMREEEAFERSFIIVVSLSLSLSLLL